MFKLKINKNQKISEDQIVKILFYVFPLSFIIGNLAVSVNVLLFIVSSLFFLSEELLTFDVFFFTLLALGIYKLNSRQYIQQIRGVK